MLEFIIFEQAQDKPLRIKAVFNRARYREETAIKFARLFISEIESGLQG